eukprot:354773-Chlamydomonas_euryale.AAC.5
MHLRRGDRKTERLNVLAERRRVWKASYTLPTHEQSIRFFPSRPFVHACPDRRPCTAAQTTVAASHARPSHASERATFLHIRRPACRAHSSKAVGAAWSELLGLSRWLQK